MDHNRAANVAFVMHDSVFVATGVGISGPSTVAHHALLLGTVSLAAKANATNKKRQHPITLLPLISTHIVVKFFLCLCATDRLASLGRSCDCEALFLYGHNHATAT